MVAVEERIRRLLLAFERLDASWRARHALTANEQLVLMFLACDGPLTPTDLSARTGLTTAGMSALVDRLEAEGFVQRRRRPDDRRRVLVTLTKRALRAWLEFEEVHVQIAGSASTDSVAISDFLGEAETIVLGRARQD